jgi:hypothetical protein
VATDNDSTRGRDHLSLAQVVKLLDGTMPADITELDELRDKVDDTFEGGMPDDSMPLDLVAWVLQFDKELGLLADEPRVVIQPGLAMWLPGMIRITAPEKLAELDEKTRAALATEEVDDNQLVGDEDQEYGKLFEEWFDVSFDIKDPETGETYPYHPILKDKSIKMRVLTAEQAETARFFVATIRPDGTVISIANARTEMTF